MQAEIISIGDELLIGQVVNTNASFISEQLGRIGIDVKRITTVGDSDTDIKAALASSLAKFDIALITGGLGPTHDDITKKSVAEFFGLGFEFNDEAFENCKSIFARFGRPMPDSNRSQGEVIAGSLVLQNSCGTAAGMILHGLAGHDNKFVVIMPGVPYEMQAMMRLSIIPYFQPLSKTVIKHSVLMTTGIGESTLAELIGDEQKFLTATSTLAYLPSPTGVRLRISTRGTHAAAVENENASIVQAVSSRVEKFIYATDDVPIEALLGKLLKDRSLTIAVVESCTGGLVANRLTNIAGSSAYFLGGLIVYSNKSKQGLLGVQKETIARFGAVSEEVALEMAEGGLELTGGDIVLSTTGIAGPDGGTIEKPVGLVCLGLATSEKLDSLRITKKITFGDERLRNKERFSQAALDLARRAVLGLHLT
ncbi:MAG: competence/damage-inducible protein A [Rhizobacter sp.]|nr:competence/damage-inducible protein A [Chlorobiales bacterium]